MKIILDIKNKRRASFFMELLKSFDYVDILKVVNDPVKERTVLDLDESFQDVKLHLQGKKKLKSAKTLLNEL
jgi:hypothetical protein